MLDVSRGTGTRLTFGAGDSYDPVWSPDGSRIIFAFDDNSGWSLPQKLVSSAKEDEVVLRAIEPACSPTSWSPSGRFLLCASRESKPEKANVWVVPLDGARKLVPFLVAEFNESQAHFSPDGNWVAYSSDESGQPEVYVRSFSMNSSGTAVEPGAKWLISKGSGDQPRWRGDGRELYYRSLPDGKVMAVEISISPAFRVAPPRPVGAAIPVPSWWPGDFGSAWDSSADGKHFVAPAPLTGKPEPYTMVLNWQAGLKR